MIDREDLPIGNVTRLLDRMEAGDGEAARELFPLVYDELRRLAKRKLSDEKAGHTLEPTALVNEAYVRLVGDRAESRFRSRGGFFVAAAEAMRHILVDSARRKLTRRRGGDRKRERLDLDYIQVERPDELLAVHESLDALAAVDAQAAEIVKLHYFGGNSLAEIASLQGISRATANRRWVYARAWLKSHLEGRRDDDAED